MFIQTILITGASSGIGAELSIVYAAPQTHLILLGRDQSRLEKIALQCKDRGAKITLGLLDIRHRDDFKSWFKRLTQKHSIDIAILNAGVGNFGRQENPIVIQEIFDVNLQGLLNTLLPIIEHMQKNKHGQIALMSSLASFKGYRGKGAYCASKAAVRVLGEGLRESLSAANIKVSVICPGFVVTPLTSHNTFPMPFLMSAQKAARIIRKGLEKNKPRIAFPWITYMFSLLMAILPPTLTEKISRLLPYR
ncbi:hypothetical protein GQ61_03565 [Candidatus Nucleicultrix amoebiphila FS5]|uniref:Short-chain dehydrogenase n=1 Tax=Candidatus Nucleicultrix amoebiphila FS5 TaxID=1414854 RepID=A0A1W6N460_9PROT|nr:hypothetical protein GQ61_03565 [Candidatus Nucleicultrix amoebiphila FS5]